MTRAQFDRVANEFSPPLTFEKLNTGHAFRRTHFGSPSSEDGLFEYRAWNDNEHFEGLARLATEVLERDAEGFYSAA